jgi:HAD superfamily hydrolase (TIGR01509 family)
VIPATTGTAAAASAPAAASEPAAASPRNQRRIRVVVLDVMGVLYRAADDVAALLVPFVREHGGLDDPLVIRAHYVDASLGRHTTRELWSLLGVAGDPDALDRAYVERLELNDGVHELLDAMDQRNIAVAALSNDVSEWSLLARRRFGLDERIAPWVVSGDVGARKPDEPIFAELARALDQPLRACLFVDDRPENLAAARAKGMAVVQFAPVPVDGSPYRRIGSLFELFNRRVAT